MAKGIITQSDVKAKLSYNELTGIFTWIDSDNRIVQNGSVAGNINRNGYCYIGLYREVYRAHRLAWLYMTGKMPTKQIDHIDGNKSNNALSNLRLASNAENLKNRFINSNNKSGYRGVSWSSHAVKWIAHSMLNGKRKNLGYFKTAESAAKAFRKFAKQHYGDFYNLA